MKCPHCNDVTLVMSERQGIEIDYCPQCRGVWLDRGELDKILERDAAATAGAAVAPPPVPVHRDEYEQPRRHDSSHRGGHHDGDRHASGGYRKKRSLLSDLLDF